MTPVEFYVVDFHENAGTYTVIGRCGDLAVLKGDHFMEAWPSRVVKTADGYDRGPKVNARAVNLRVERIVAYKHELDELSPGMTAELTLRGEGAPVRDGGLSLEVDEHSAWRRRKL
jgi:hypothetical protein